MPLSLPTVLNVVLVLVLVLVLSETVLTLETPRVRVRDRNPGLAWAGRLDLPEMTRLVATINEKCSSA